MVAGLYAGVAAFGLATANAEEVQFSQLSSAAQKTINRSLQGGIVQEIDRKSQNGRTLYDVEIRRDGKNKHLRVDADGKVHPNDKLFDGNASVDIDNDKNDGKNLGVIDNPRDDADFKAEAKVDSDGVDVDTNVEKPKDRGITEDVFDKNDGKILNVLPAPSRNRDARVEADVDLDTDSDKKIEVEADVDDDDGSIAVETKPKDRGITEDVFDKNDGKILDVLPAPSRNRDARVEADADVDIDSNKKIEVEADVDDDDGSIAVETKREDRGIFRKGDGKILGIPVPGRDRVEGETTVKVDRDADITTDADGGLDTDKNDGRILGAPKRGFEALSMSELPPVVRETIRREAGGYKVVEIERASLEGQRVYEVDIERDGKNRELHIAANGTILKDSDREAVGAPAVRERGVNQGK